MSGTILTNLLDRKNGGACSVCGYTHNIQTQCSREAMAFRISKLLEANQIIPSLLQANKEATVLAGGYKMLLKKADEAHAILMNILETHGDTGAKIREEYLGALNSWAETKEESTSQGTSDNQPEQLSLFSQENSISPETVTNHFTKQPSGLSSEQGLSS